MSITDTSSDHVDIIPPVLIHPSATLEPGCRIGPNVWIGPRATLARGARIRNALLLDNVEVGPDACIVNAVVGWGSRVGAWARIEGRDTDAAHLNATDMGVKVSSAAVVGSGVSVGDGVVVRNCIVLPDKELKTSFHNEVIM